MGNYRKQEHDEERRTTVALDPADPAPGIQHAERRWLEARYPWPQGVPRGRALVDFWADMQEPFDPRLEQARQVPVLGVDGYRTEYPYHERLTQTLWAYLRAPEDMRRLVIAAREDGHWWRGEPREALLDIMARTEHMREVGLEAYRGETVKRLKALIKGATQEKRRDSQEAVGGEDGQVHGRSGQGAKPDAAGGAPA